MANMSVVDRIEHYQRSLQRCTDNELRTLHCIDKLYNLPVTVQHLKETGVGRTVNALRKFDGSVGDAAKALVAKWKTMVADDESSEEEDEACVPDAPEGYSDHSTSPESNRDNAISKNPPEWPKQSHSTDNQEFSRDGRKNSSSENSKPRENEAKSSRDSSSDKYKCSKNGIDNRHTKSESKNDSRSESKNDTKRESRHDTKSELRNDSKSASRNDSKSESRNHTKSESRNDSKSESRNDSRSSKKSKSSRDSRDSKGDSRKDSISNEPSTSSKSRVRTEDSRKDSSRVSSSNSGSSKNSHNHDSDRKRKLDLPSNERESSKRRKSEESPVQDKYEDPDEIATQVLSRDSDEETTKMFPDTSSASDEERTSMTKIKQESPDSSPQNERSSSSSRHSSSRSDKSSKSKSRESSVKSTSSSSGKSRRESDKNEKSKRESTNSDHRKNEKRKDRSPSKESSSKSKSHSSSSSSSKIRETSKERDENSDNYKVKKNKSDCDSKDSKEQFKEPKEKKVKKTKISKGDGIDCNSGASFAEALGMCTDRPVARKKPVSPTSAIKTVKTESGISTPSSSSSSSSRTFVKVKTEPQVPSDPEPLSLLAPNVKLEPLNVDLASTLPEISPNYKPLPALQMNSNHRKQEESRALSDVIYAKTQRTKVYSGMKSGYTSVPTLCEEAIRVLIENIHELGFTGGIPYDILKPVLERATPDQLFTVENYNPYLIGDTDQLWQFHCNREFRTKKREEMESSRDMYLRCREEREAKLKALTANIKESIDKSVPVRSAKLAYVDKPPRNVLRQQAKYGTAKISTSSSDLKKQMILSGSSNAATNIAVPPPPMSRHKSSSSGPMKKAKAPLMAKALQLIKGRYKR